MAGCLITGEEPVRPRRKSMENPSRNVYRTADGRWLMLGMTNAQHYWPAFCAAVGSPDGEHDPRFATCEARYAKAEEVVRLLDELFGTAPSGSGLGGWRRAGSSGLP